MPNKFTYDLIAELVTDDNTKLYKYKSRNSGLIIYICQVNGPLVGGYLTFATENCDDGLSTALGHLVFSGSEKYPYKGVLDTIASRCLSEGWKSLERSVETYTDHTCYTLSTAGEEGFLKILPIYLDHLLFPKLTDAAYTTQIHHINGVGEDGGVMYCEMQSLENLGSNQCFRAVSHALFPDCCGYKFETSGLVKNLRESTTNEKVRAYHKKFYRPENLCLIIVGQVEPGNVFEALVSVEERILQEGERDKFVRLWQTPVPPLTKSVTLEVPYPKDEEEFGQVVVSWRGPAANDTTTYIALSILLDYLTDTSAAPLNQEFVEIDDPLTNDVSYGLTEHLVGCFNFHFLSVPSKRLKELKEKLFAILKGISDGKEKIDMQRMATMIEKRKVFILSFIEEDPHNYMASCLITDFLYGHTVEDLKNRIREVSSVEKLLEADAQFWTTLLQTYMIDGNHVAVLGIPSSELSYTIIKSEKERINKQKEKLGLDGLKKKAEILKKSIEENEILPPKEMLSSITVPSVKSIEFLPLKRICNVCEGVGDDVAFSMNKMPCRFQVDFIQSNFVRLFVLIDTSHLPLESRMYLPLLVDLLDKSAIKRNSEIVSYQDVVKQIAEDTLDIDIKLGFRCRSFFCKDYSQVLCLSLLVEEKKYEKSVEWVREILYQLCIEPSQIKLRISKMLMDIPVIKQSGYEVVESMMKNLCFRPESNHWTGSIFRQHIFLNKLQKQLEKNPEEVVAKLNDIRESITNPDKLIVHLALNLDSIKTKIKPEEVWLKGFLPPSLSSSFMNSNVKKCSEYIQCITGSCMKGLIVGIGSVESTFLLQSTICSIESIDDYASLLVLINYFIHCEGPMWHQIQACGYSNDFNICVSRDTGLICFSLSMSAHPVKAYKEASNIINTHLNGTSKWDVELLESARSIVMFELIERIKTVKDVVNESLRSSCRDTNIDFNTEMKELIEKVSVVTTIDMERVGLQYMKPLFNPELSWCAVTCNSTKVNEICKEFEKLSRKLTIVPSLEQNFMCEY